MYTVVAYFVISSFSGTFVLVSGDAGNIWGYQDGIPPARWHTEYRTCGGTQQSPIDIQINQVTVDHNLRPFNFRDLERIGNIRMTLKNNGHTVEVEVEGQNTLTLSGGGLNGSYKIKQFHFHWGSIDRRGSEHDINGRMFPMEMHVVTYSARYRMFEEAKNVTGGLAVLSFLFDIGGENQAFNEIISHLGNIAHKDDYHDIQSFSLTSLFPRSTDVYYRYYGSLTTPPCYESVIWTIFQEHIMISERQINVFRHLGDRHFNRFREISDNFRPTQPLNGRRVFTNSVRGLRYTRQGQRSIRGKVIGRNNAEISIEGTPAMVPMSIFQRKGPVVYTRLISANGMQRSRTYGRPQQIMYHETPTRRRQHIGGYSVYVPWRNY